MSSRRRFECLPMHSSTNFVDIYDFEVFIDGIKLDQIMNYDDYCDQDNECLQIRKIFVQFTSQKIGLCK